MNSSDQIPVDQTRLSLLSINQVAKISELRSLNDESDFGSRLAHLGLLPGEQVRIIRKAPFFADPIIIEVRGSQLAMTLEEASAIIVSI